MSGALIWTVFAHREQAKGVITQLLEENLVACANISSSMDSIFIWQGKIEEQSECGVLLKTNSDILKVAISRLEYLHPYETPAILGWHSSEAAASTEAWLGALDGSSINEGSSTA